MKKRMPLKIWILSFAVVAGLAACKTDKLRNALDDFSVIVGFEPITTSGSLMLLDATTGELIDKAVKVRFEGQNGVQPIDIYSEPLFESEVKRGLFSFGLSNIIEPSATKPAEIVLRISAEDYLPITKRISWQDTGNFTFRIPLVPLANPPAGVEVKQVGLGSSDANGTFTDSISIELNSHDEPAGLFVPENSRFLDANGNPLTGALKARVTYFDPAEPQAMGGLSDLLTENHQDSAIGVLGALNLSITDLNGNQASSVEASSGKRANDRSYILNFVINGNTYIELQQVLRIAISYPTVAERVILYQLPEVSNLPNGRVNLRFLLNSALIRTVALVYFSEQPCNQVLTVNRNGNQGNIPLSITERGFLRSFDLLAGQNTVALRNISRGTKRVISALNHTNFESTLDVCSSANPSISLPAPPNPLIDADLTLNVTCKDPNEKPRVSSIPAVTILYREVDAPAGTAWRAAKEVRFQYDASIRALTGVSCKVFGVEVGRRYEAKAVYDNNIIEYSGVITGPITVVNEVIDDDICQ